MSGNEGPSAHKTVSVTWGEPYVTTTYDRSRVQHPSTPLPPTIQQNCYTGSSECTPKYLFTHQNLEMTPGTRKLGRRPRKTPSDRGKSPLSREIPQVTWHFPRSLDSSTDDYPGDQGFSPVTNDKNQGFPHKKWFYSGGGLENW
jgi:hypothetical protein